MKKTRKLLLLLAVVCTLLVCCMVSASAETSGDYTFTISGNEATITDLNPTYIGDLIIPNKLNGYEVVAIGANAFDNNGGGIKSVVIPEGVRSIGNYAFSGCISMTSAVLPSTLTEIGEYAFDRCESLESIRIPDEVATVKDNAFNQCTNLTNITVGEKLDNYSIKAFSNCGVVNFSVNSDNTIFTVVDGVIMNKDKTQIIKFPTSKGLSYNYSFPGITGIADKAFAYCTNLSKISIPDKLTSIGKEAFLGSGLAGLLTLPSTLMNIGEGAFADTNLTQIIVEADITDIPRIFSDCDSLESLTIGEGTEKLGDYAFSSCANLLSTSVSLPKSLTVIGDYAFEYCTSIGDLSFINNVVTIGDYAFRGCTGLKNLSISDNVLSIGEYAFANCTNITTITTGNGLTEIACNSFSKCSALTSLTTGNNLKNIADDAFEKCYNLADIIISDSVETIDRSAFSDCYNVKNLTIGKNFSGKIENTFKMDYYHNFASFNISEFNSNYSSDDFGVLYNKDKTILIRYPSGATNKTYIIPNSVTALADSAFYWDSSLESLIIPDNVTKIGNHCFEMSNISNIDLSDNIIELGADAFRYCKIKEINLPNNLVSIGGKAFAQCSLLESVTIPTSVTSLGDYIFDECKALSSVIVDCDIIGVGMFSYCSNLADVKISNTLLKIEDHAFDNCKNLKSVEIPDSVTHIDSYAFRGCNSLTEVILPSVTHIDSYAFRGCESLTEVILPSIISINEHAFDGCTELANVVIGKAIEEIYSYAFNECGLKTVHYLGKSYQFNGLKVDENNTSFIDAKKHYCSIIDMPTCTKPGYEGRFKCGSCSYVLNGKVAPELGHSFTNYISNGDATCTEDGTKTAACDNGCGEEDTVADVDSKKGHSFTNYVSNGDATCTEDGTQTAECDNGCGEKDVKAFEKLGHSFTNYISNGDATCTEDGTKTAVCDNGCGEEETVTDTDSKTGHSFTNYVSDNNATCTEDGAKTAVCDNSCGEEDTVADVDSKTGHSFTNYISNGDATCTADGTKTAVCDNGCGEEETVTDTDSKIGHSFTNYISNGDATCTEDGTKTAVCDNGCGEEDTVTDTDSKTGHSFTNYVSDNNATCTADGTKTAVCANGCGEEDTVADVDSKTGHSFGEWTYDWDNLVRTSKCLNCDEVKSEALEKAEDTENEIEILAPADPDTTFTVENVADEADERYALVVETLESYEGDATVETVYDITLENSEGVSVQPDGTVQVKLPVAEDHSNYKVFRINDDGTYTDMNATVVDGYVVFETDHFSLYVIVDTSEKHEHEYNGVVTTPATHTKEGVMTYTCSCGDSYTEAIEKDPKHHWELKYFAPTCTEDGYDLAVCACGDEFVYKTYVALNHKYDYKLNYAATHLKDGLETYTCSRCGYSYTNTLPRKTEHYYSYYTKTTEPTCTEQGYTLHECECGDSYKDNYKAALGHKRSPHGDWCDRCGATMAPAKPDTSNCSCNCHKTGFMGFIYKLQRFFWKLFKTNKTCACGTVHY